MFQKKLLLPFLFLFITNIFAQEPIHSSYDWNLKPDYTIEDTTKDIIAVKEKVIHEFVFEGEEFLEYFIEHRVVWLNSDDAIEDYNKIYLPLSEESALVKNKARVIKKNGEIIELDNSKILTADDEETGRKYKYFAFEGIEKGSFVEYFYIQKKSPSYTGKKIKFQSTYEKNNIEFDVYAPSNLEFEFKSYNGLPEVQKDENSKDRLHWSLRVDKVEALDKEENAPYEASKASLVFKLDRNTFSNKTVTSYSTVAQNIYRYYHPENDDKVQEELKTFLSDSGTSQEFDADENVRKLDNYIKNNLYYSEAYNESLEDLKSILANKAANERGIVKLYAACLQSLNIDYEIVLTSDRKAIKFDRDFEANNFLQEFLLYFPKTKKYLSPSDFNTRYGYPPALLTDNYGLFIQPVKVGDYISAVAKVKYIKALEANDSVDNMVIDVAFDTDDLTVSKINLRRTMSGYYGSYIHPYLDLIIPDRKDDFLNTFAKNIDENAEIDERTMENDKPELFGVKPLIFNYKITSESFVEKAGNKYLFKLGNLIGPQIEMYQEKERILPYENDFNRSYYRTINVSIPEGYTISNLEDINIENRYQENGKELFSFHSYYKLEGNKLMVTADEHYYQNIVPKEIYEEFRKVINSAADFNKITLILQPK